MASNLSMFAPKSSLLSSNTFGFVEWLWIAAITSNWVSLLYSFRCSVLTFFFPVETTVEVANKVGAAEVVSRIVDGLKDDQEPFRKMVMEAIEQVLANLGASQIDGRLEEQLVDGIIHAYQEQVSDDTNIILNG